jgi:hypothetical protein
MNAPAQRRASASGLQYRARQRAVGKTNERRT